jgi:dUTP pyrophosphatase
MVLFDQTFPCSDRAVVLHYPRDVAQSVEVLIVADRIPAYSHPGDAGADLTAAVAVQLAPGARSTVPTGVSIALPDGFVAFVVPRSGLAAKHGITIVNSPGTVDAGYRGEISVTLMNTDSSVPYSVAVGDRIAQLVIMPVSKARFIPVATLPGSQRGGSGFGSTGNTTRDGASLHDDQPHDDNQGELP